MSVKIRRLLIIYTAAALLALSGYAYAAARQLEADPPHGGLRVRAGL